MSNNEYFSLHIIILAAGEGKRMKSVKPKVLMPLAGRPMLAHVLETARALNPAAIHVVYGHGGEQVQAAFAQHSQIHWVLQDHQLGTGHAVQLAMPSIPDDAHVLVLYGDVPLIRSETLQKLVETPVPLAVLGIMPDNPTGYGRILLDKNGRVSAIVEEKDATLDQRKINLANSGIIFAEAKSLKQWVSGLRSENAQGEFYLTEIFVQAAIANTPAHVVLCEDAHEAIGANDAWQLAELERYFQLRQARALCAQGVRLADPTRFDLRGELEVGHDVEIDVNVIIEGKVTLGSGTRIGPFCYIRNSQLEASTVVLSHCSLDGMITRGACSIGPFARLRPGTDLEADTHIGNFVEVKETKIGKKSKANHLTYLGDAVIGSEVNIGAGTITCNYDGANKHQTTIEDGAFIGSNSALIAPVTIGKNATIGAGSAISNDVATDELSLTRAEQRSFSGWQRPQKTLKTD